MTLMGEEILWTFLRRGIQLLRQREATVNVSPGPSCLIRPSFTRPGGTKINTWVQEALVPKDLARRETHHACTKRLWWQRLKWLVEVDPELVCP
jgi:hypothetical protein